LSSATNNHHRGRPNANSDQAVVESIEETHILTVGRPPNNSLYHRRDLSKAEAYFSANEIFDSLTEQLRLIDRMTSAGFFYFVVAA
jgi:hypothetical protein